MIQDSSSKDSNLFSQSLFGSLMSVFGFTSKEIMNGDVPNSFFVTKLMRFFGSQFLIILLLAMAVVGCYFCRKGAQL